MARKKKEHMECTREHAEVVADMLRRVGFDATVIEGDDDLPDVAEVGGYKCKPGTGGVNVWYVRSRGEQAAVHEASLADWCENRFWKASTAEKERYEKHGVDAWRSELAEDRWEEWAYPHLVRAVNLNGLCRLGRVLRLVNVSVEYESYDRSTEFVSLRVPFPKAAEFLGIDLTPPLTAVERVTLVLSEAGLAVVASDFETPEVTGLACEERDDCGVTVRPVVSDDDLAIIDQEAFNAWCERLNYSGGLNNPAIASAIRTAYEQDEVEQPAMLAAATATLTTDLLAEATQVLTAASFEVTSLDGVLVVTGGDRG